MPERRKYKTWLIVLIHALSWITVFALPDLLRPDHDATPDKSVFEANKQAFEVMAYIYRILWVGFFYLHAYYLIPRFAYAGKFLKYTGSILFIIAFWIVFGYIYFQYVFEGFENQPFNLRNSLIFSIVPTGFLMICSAAYKLIVDRIQSDKRERDRQNENLKTELSLLRSQVSPHFMFNVLNSMVALARKKSDLLEPSLIKLSQLMRYMLYETESRVSLQKEVEYLQSYIDLQTQRFGNSIRIETNFDARDLTLEIEPMLLIPFVENAFKHGVGLVEDPVIKIDLKLDGHVLHFNVCNHYVENSTEIRDSASGIGLANVARRLKLLYPGKHQYTITRDKGCFRVDLQIDLA